MDNTSNHNNHNHHRHHQKRHHTRSSRTTFQYLSNRLKILEKWTELAIRPSCVEDCPKEDLDLWEDEVDDIPKLQKRCLHVRNLMNDNLPAFPTAQLYESYLIPKPSQIPNAGLGLFYCPPLGPNTINNTENNESEEKKNDMHQQQNLSHYQHRTTNDDDGNEKEVNEENNSKKNSYIIPPGKVLCYYTGHRHTYQSSKSLKDTSYLLMVGNQNSNDRDNDGDIVIDAINHQADAYEGEDEDEEDTSTSAPIFVDPGPLPQIKARYINDPINDEFINCKFVAQRPNKYSCAVVSTKSISPNEELFVSYGDLYNWSSSSSSSDTSKKQQKQEERHTMSYRYLH